jgi:hypothetical protein
MALEREIETYRKRLPELLAQKGQYVLIHGEEVVGVFPSFEAALEAGYARTLTEPFLVREIRETEKVLISSRSLRPCPTEPGPSTPPAQ